MSPAGPTPRALAEAKVRRQKQFVAVGSVILLALLGFQLPKLLGGDDTARSTIPNVTTPSQPASPLATASGTLPDTDRVAVEPKSGQLISFGLFKSKDPFVQQLSTVTPDPALTPSDQTVPAVTAPTTATPFGTTTTAASQTQPAPVRTAPNGGLPAVTTTTPASTVLLPATPVPFAPATTTPKSSTTPVATTPVATTPNSGTTTPATTATTPVTAPTAVAISINGACENVAVKGTFPGSEDIFRVVSIAKDGKSAKIAVVGGAYDSGQAAATLKLGVKLTLVNTADGTRYVLLLESRCDFEAEPVATPTTTTTPTATVAPPAPTTTATTPIVTDALDTTTPTG